MRIRAAEWMLTGLLLLLLPAGPAPARVDEQAGVCFQRRLGQPGFVKQLGPCRIYRGTLGFERALWGFILADRQRVAGWQNVGSEQVVVNERPGFLWLPGGLGSPDRLQAGQVFCLGQQGSSLITCGRLK
jgi:hypothetical protein